MEFAEIEGKYGAYRYAVVRNDALPTGFTDTKGSMCLVKTEVFTDEKE